MRTRCFGTSRLTALAGGSMLVLAVATAGAPSVLDVTPAAAQGHDKGGGDHASGHSGKGRGSDGEHGGTGGHGSDKILHGPGGHDTDHATTDHGGTKGRPGSAGRTEPGATARGHGSGRAEDRIVHGPRGSGETHETEDEESDRPAWAGVPGRDGKPGRGNTEPGTSKGTLYGDLYVVQRHPDGTPVLDANGNVVLIGSDGSLIHKTAEGDIPEDKLALVQEVEFGRLNVSRSPDDVLESRLAEAVRNLNTSETPLTRDASGRLSYTVDGETRTIDSPLENLALYVELMNKGGIGGLTAPVGADLAHVADDKLGADDLALGAHLLAAAADKTGTVTVDQVAYLNRILGVTGTDPLTAAGDRYYDFRGFTYDRSEAWGDVVARVLVYDATAQSWKATDIAIYDGVFGRTDASATNADGFSRAADDALQVIEYIHEYEVPALPSQVN